MDRLGVVLLLLASLQQCAAQSMCYYIQLRSDWSLITGKGEGGASKREGGGHVKFYPYEKRGWTKF